MAKTLTAAVDDDLLIQWMDSCRQICSAVHAVRAKEKIHLRQPLPSFTLLDPQKKFGFLPFAADLIAIIKDECNVKEIRLKCEDYEVVM